MPVKVKRQTVCCRIVKKLYILRSDWFWNVFFWTYEIGGAVCRTDVIGKDDVDVMLESFVIFEVIYGIGCKTVTGKDK